MIDYLKRTFYEEGIGIAFAYCSYKEKGDQTVVKLLASLLQHLLQRPVIIPSKVCSLFKQHMNKGTRLSLAECSEILRIELAACSRAFVVVDALDECDNRTQSSLISEMLRLPPTTSIMVTSRHAPSIENGQDQPRCIEIRARDADVKIYLEGQIEKESRLKRHIQADSNLRITVLDTIVKETQGMLVSYIVLLIFETLARKADFVIGFSLLSFT